MIAAARAASQWLDYIYTKSLKATKLFSHAGPNAPPTPATSMTPPTPFSAFPPTNDSGTLFKLIEATSTLNDALYFARFTAHFVLTQPIITSISDISTTPTQQHLATAIQTRQKQALQDLRVDLDLLIDPLAEALAEDNKHYHDCAPGDASNNEDDETFCPIDKDGATEFLSALRDANLWPATRWPSSSLLISGQVGTVVEGLANFRVPDYDSSEACYWCAHVEDKFATSLNLVRAMHKDRLWGLCLDCYKTQLSGGGASFQGECRFEHFKVGVGGKVQEGGEDGMGTFSSFSTSSTQS
jgi:hypothetical protein